MLYMSNMNSVTVFGDGSENTLFGLDDAQGRQPCLPEARV